MKVHSFQPICNYQVYTLISPSESHKSIKNHNQNVATIDFTVSEYLSKTFCPLLSPEKIKSFLNVLKEKNIDLTESERIVLLNNRPKSDVEFYAMIEDCEERFNSDKLQELMDIMNDLFPVPESIEEDS